MTKAPKAGLILINLFALLFTVLLVLLPPGIWRVIVGLPFMLFFPGYALVASLFPHRKDLATVERLGLALGLSFAVTSLTGLILNVSGWQTIPFLMLVALDVFIAITSVIAWYRRYRLPQAGRYSFFAETRFLSLRGQSLLNVVLSFILTAAILGAIGALAYAVFAPKVGQPFTEFYVLGNSSESYSKEVMAGERVEIIVGIVSHEQMTTSYMVEVRVEGDKRNEMGPLELGPGEKLERVLSFVPERPGVNQKVELLLYKNAERDPYLILHLWLNVK